MNSNQKVYSNPNFVHIYAHDNYLQKAESVIFNTYKKELSEAYLLDIGFGGGRTTRLLVSMVKNYTGVDYSPLMVEHCKNNFHQSNISGFYQADARSLTILEDEKFDFALFSFNGIDCSDFEGRNEIVKQVFNKLKSGGHFIFSFHNLFNIKKLYSFQFPKNPFKYMKEYQRVKKIIDLNGPRSQYEGKDYFSLYDGADDFETLYFYIKPSLQINLLEKAGFKVLKIYEANSGFELNIDKADETSHPWIYLDCVKI